MAQVTVLMVAEKPSIAQALSHALSAGTARKRKGLSPSVPVFEYDGSFHGQSAHFRVTSTTGHMYSLDFHPQFNNQDKVEPIELFAAPTQHYEDPRGRISQHLVAEAQGCAALVLWLDCDREGENICFEVIQTVSYCLAAAEYSGGYCGNIFRARFSSLAPADLVEAMGTLSTPN